MQLNKLIVLKHAIAAWCIGKYTTPSTDQMAEWYGASASGSVDLGFDS